jgi:predicted DNA-binding transcriptional regulator YafY
MADQLERLTNLIALLLETRVPLTFDRINLALAGQYPDDPVARRGAFERDKALLRAEGVPIESTVLSGAEAGVSAYWIDRSSYELGDMGLTPEETRALQVAVAAVHLGVDWGANALLKLAPGEADDDTVEADEGLAALPSSPALPALFEANSARASVSFAYRGEGRTLDPYGLLSRDGFWYVVGRDHGRGELRTFRVDRIEGKVEIGTPGAFDVPAGFDPAAAVLDDPKAVGSGAPVEALVWVDPLRAARVQREVGDAAVAERRDDGSVVVRVPATNREAFLSWVLGLLDHAEVLAPPELRALVVDALTAVVGR